RGIAPRCRTGWIAAFRPPPTSIHPSELSETGLYGIAPLEQRADGVVGRVVAPCAQLLTDLCCLIQQRANLRRRAHDAACHAWRQSWHSNPSCSLEPPSTPHAKMGRISATVARLPHPGHGSSTATRLILTTLSLDMGHSPLLWCTTGRGRSHPQRVRLSARHAPWGSGPRPVASVVGAVGSGPGALSERGVKGLTCRAIRGVRLFVLSS